MNKIVVALVFLGVASIPFLQTVQADPYQQRVITTTAMIGATTGAVIGSVSDQTVQGAMTGGVFGTVTGVLLARLHQSQPIYRHHWRSPRYLQPLAYRHHGVLAHRAAWRYRAHERYEHAYYDGYRHGYRNKYSLIRSYIYRHGRRNMAERRHEWREHDG